MKKINLFIAVFAIVFTSLSSCKKEVQKINTQIINVELKFNETYILDLNSVKQNNNPAISNQAAHYSISEIQQSLGIKPYPEPPASYHYTYVPTLNYVGTDEVQIKSSTEEEEHGEHHDKDKGNGKCSSKHHEENDDDDIINITVIRFNVTSKIN